MAATTDCGDIASQQATTAAIEIDGYFDVDEEKYKCKICQSEFQGRVPAQRHFEFAHNAPRGTRIESNWRLLFSAAGECSLCDYKFISRSDRKESQERTFFCSLRHHIDTRHPGKRREMTRSALGKATESGQNPSLSDFASKSAIQSVEFPTNSFPCNECSRTFSSPTALLKHSIGDHFRQPIECSQCGEIFGSIRMLNRHRQDQHMHKCRYCSMCFETEADNRAHMLNCFDSEGMVVVSQIEIGNHFEADGEKHICIICGLEYFGQGQAQNHFKNVHDALLGKRKETRLAWRSLFSAVGECSLCDYKYNSKNIARIKPSECFLFLRKHLDSCHPGKREEMVAEALNEATKVRDDAAIALYERTLNCLAVKVPKEGYSCEECGQLFPSSTECFKHRNTVHPRLQKSLQCSLCGKVLSSAYNLRQHTKSFHASRCRYCMQEFRIGMDADSHVQTCVQQLQESQFPCSQCDKTFSAERLLKAHLAMKHTFTQLGVSSAQIGVIKEEYDNGSKRRKLADEAQISSLTNAADIDDTACGRGIVLCKEEDANVDGDMHNMISFAIVKEECE
uniref:C2H2-type domain-containing protein n=1 Tax=Plectus sambesii TaxID=2011161 RepID=A0A914X618_9BILA